jgi:hypothetical protein
LDVEADLSERRDCMPANIFDRFFSLMAKDDFAEVQQTLEAIALELKNEKDPAAD